MPFTTIVNRAALDHIFQKAVWPQPGNLSIALSTTTPDADGNNVTEPSGNGYARVATTPAEWDRNSNPNEMTNNVRKDFPEATGPWGTITHFVLYDNTTPIGWGALTASQAVTTGQQPYFNAGELIFRYTTA